MAIERTVSTSRRERLREQTRTEIKELVRQQMRERGTGNVSLTAIARVMQLSVPALYTYFASRDELLTALTLDANAGLATVLAAAASSGVADDYQGRLLRVMTALRDWALAHPTDFELTFGNPLPNFTPPDHPDALACRGFKVLVTVFQEAFTAGALVAQVPPTTLRTRDPQPPEAAALYAAFTLWSRALGLLIPEIFGRTCTLITEPSTLYEHEIRLHLALFQAALESGA